MNIFDYYTSIKDGLSALINWLRDLLCYFFPFLESWLKPTPPSPVVDHNASTSSTVDTPLPESSGSSDDSNEANGTNETNETRPRRMRRVHGKDRLESIRQCRHTSPVPVSVPSASTPSAPAPVPVSSSPTPVPVSIAPTPVSTPTAPIPLPAKLISLDKYGVKTEITSTSSSTPGPSSPQMSEDVQQQEEQEDLPINPMGFLNSFANQNMREPTEEEYRQFQNMFNMFSVMQQIPPNSSFPNRP